MRKSRKCIAGVLWAALLTFAAGVAHAKVDYLCLKGGSVIDPALRTMKRTDLIIRGNLIDELRRSGATATPCQGRTIDISGAFVVPGFVDTHVHAWGNPSPVKEANDEEWGDEGTAERVLQTGVVAFLSMSSEAEDLLLRDRLRGSSRHAQMVIAAPTFPGASGAKQARDRIAAMVKTGADLIKLFAGGAQMGVMLQEARRFNKKTVVHIANWEQGRQAVKGGATAITHLEDEAVIPNDLVQEMAKRNTISIPTMAVQCDLASFANNKTPAWWSDPLLQLVTGDVLRADYRHANDFSGHAIRTIRWQAAGCRTNDFASIKRLREGRVNILAGSDTGNVGTFQGFSLHREMELLVEAGLSTWEALEAGTSAGAAFLSLPFGVTPGAEASIVVLEKSPIDDIRNTRLIRHVIHHGQLLRPLPLAR